MHGSPTEAVRLPADGDNGQVTVHPAVRSKLPLKRKVRNGKVRRKHKNKESVNNNLNSPIRSKTSPKKKKRVSAAVGAEENKKKLTVDNTVMEVPHSKVKNKPTLAINNNKKRKKKKETIDYSNAQPDGDGKKGLISAEVVHNPLTPDTDPVGKVQNWLLKSQYALPKSKSTPAGLTTDKSRRSPHKRPTIRPRTDKSKSHSVGNIPSEKDKVRLQVVYKPPFKFSVKLRKPEKTSVVVERDSGNKKQLDKPKVPRTGVLVRTSVANKQPKDEVVPAAALVLASPQVEILASKPTDDIDSNIHTVQSDLEVLLSENEGVFSDK